LHEHPSERVNIAGPDLFPTLNRKEAAFAVALTLVFTGVLALVAVPSTAPGSSSAYTLPPPSACDGQVPVSIDSLLPVRNGTRLANGTSVNETFYPALFLHPNSTGVICVTYADASGTAAIPLVAGRNFFAGTFNITKTSVGGPITSLVPISAGILNISANPAEIHFQAGQSEVVAYTLKSSLNSTGVYQAFFPPASCSGLPVFVGESAPQVNATGYSQLASIFNMACTDLYGNLHVESIGLNNVVVSYVGQPSDSSP
jgi:hypothetical protein